MTAMIPKPSSQPELIRITPLPQYVPSSTCFRCDVCCRFPEGDSFLRPYFTADEIRTAVGSGINAARFPDHAGSQIELVPDRSGEGFLCPAFDPATSRCRIYESRPIDCQIYPLALMWSVDHAEVVLGWDTKCPFLDERGKGQAAEDSGEKFPLKDYAEKIAHLLQEDEAVKTITANPQLIGPFQDDVVVLRTLPHLTERLNAGRGARGGLSPLASPPTLHPLTVGDRSRLEQAMTMMNTSLSAYGFAAHFIWRKHFAYSWCEIADHVCLFAQYADGLYMPLPPLGQGPVAESVARAFALMRDRNHGSAVSRIENVPEELRSSLEMLGYRLTPKDPDYFYSVSDLVSLSGDRYKSQRAACNRFIRDHQVQLEPYREDDREACLALYRLWALQQEARGLDGLALAMLKEAESVHGEALTFHETIGLVGRVVQIDGVICAYTFGYALSSAVFCVLLEVADRSMNGLAQFIFREFCREAFHQGYQFINTMDDSGLERLRISKYAYRPLRFIPSYIAVDPSSHDIENPARSGP